MFRLPDIALSATAQHQLERWQAEVDAHSRYADRVDAAKRAFDQRNTTRNRTFAEVRGTRNHERADYTLRILRLNKREYLRKARETAFVGYQDMLTRYISLRERKAPTAQLELRRKAVQRSPHRTVWKEMQRQHQDLAVLRLLFREAPEALSW